jgi:hypothetical protein
MPLRAFLIRSKRPIIRPHEPLTISVDFGKSFFADSRYAVQLSFRHEQKPLRSVDPVCYQSIDGSITEASDHERGSLHYRPCRILSGVSHYHKSGVH